MTDLTKAIADLRRVAVSKTEHLLAPHDEPFATILNAVASGDLIPKADHKLAVAEAFRRAGDIARIRSEQHANMALDGEPEQARLREAMEAAFTDIRWAILALADTDALAEVQALRAELAATQAKLADAVGALHDAYNHQLAACAEWEEEMAKARGVEKHKRLAARYAGHYSAMNDLAKRIAALEGAKPFAVTTPMQQRPLGTSAKNGLTRCLCEKSATGDQPAAF